MAFERLIGARYGDRSYVIQRKVKTFVFILSAMLVATAIYLGFVLVTNLGVTNDLPLLLGLFLSLSGSLVLLRRGYFTWAVNLASVAMVVSLSAIVYFGVTLDPLKIYNMALLHMLPLGFSFLIASKDYQILGVAAIAWLANGVFLVGWLIPASDGNLTPYLASFVTATLIYAILSIIGVQIRRLLHRSLSEVKERLEFDQTTGLPNRNKFIGDLSYGDTEKKTRLRGRVPALQRSRDTIESWPK